MAGYSPTKFYLEKNNLQHFTFSTNPEMPIKAVISHFPPHTTAENISNNLEDLGFNVITVRQMMANRLARNGQTHVEPLPLFLVTLTRNIKSQRDIQAEQP
jgi:hypothetical protein